MTFRWKPALCAAAGLVLAYALLPRPSLYGATGFSHAVYDRNGRLLRLTLADDERYRLYTPLSEISEIAQSATLIYEDRFFRLHPGVNPGALLRAFWTTYVSGERTVGGSTITMQLARKRFDLDTRSMPGKLAQIARAIQLDRHYSKDDILEAYLNLAPYGGNVEGIGTAARVYFDKSARDLSLTEALALAVVPQNPTGRNPATENGLRGMTEARQRLLDRWRAEEAVDEETRDLFELPLRVRSPGELPYRAPHFARGFVRQARPGTHVTTLDPGLQNTLEHSIRDYVARRQHAGIGNAAALLVDHRSMEVLASVGSADFFDDAISGRVDGVRSKRSPGSALKPFIYALAMDRGLIHPMSMLKDAPRRYRLYTPENIDRGFMGPVFARDALTYSRNVPAVGLLARLGSDEFHRFLTAAQISGMRAADHYGLALALGGNEVTMEELVRLYALLPNGGRLRQLKYALNGGEAGAEPQLLSPEASFLTLDMLSANPEPAATGFSGEASGPAVAWKTGTSFAYRDAWAVGVFGPYVMAVWIGNFDGAGNPAFVGRKAAAPLFFQLVHTLSADAQNRHDWMGNPGRLNLRRVDVCASTGDLPGRHCPATTPSWFIPGVSPIEVSEVHRAVRVSTATGLRSCAHEQAGTREEVYEFWPSDLLRVFRQAGIAIRSPPPWEPGCSMNLTASSGAPPEIRSPQPGIAYRLRPNRLDDEEIPFSAVVDADTEYVNWFVDERFIARVARDRDLFWRPRIGEFTVRAVDDMGRSATTQMTVKLAQ